MNPTDPTAELIAYAREVEAMLKAQHRYFHAAVQDKPRLLQESRDWERRVLNKTRAVLDRLRGGGLFDPEDV